MNKLIIVFATVLFFLGCTPRIYQSKNFYDVTSNHKIVAILPAEVSIQLRPNEMKKTTAEQIRDMERKTGENIQDKMFSWLLKRSDKYKYTVAIQDISKTNATLLKNGINYESIRANSMDDLARLLGVDAVLTCKISMQKPMSDGAAVAVGILLGAWGTATNNVTCSILINEAKKGDLIWKYDYNASGSVGSNADNLVDALMRNASKKFPYNARK